MITSKQRSYLKSLAHHEEPICYIGKDGLTENVIKEMDVCLEKRELIKVKIQESSELNPKDTANQVVEILGAEFVQAIGRKFSIYRQAKDVENRKIALPRK